MSDSGLTIILMLFIPFVAAIVIFMIKATIDTINHQDAIELKEKQIPTAQLEFKKPQNNTFLDVKNSYDKLIEALNVDNQFKTWNQIQNFRKPKNFGIICGIYIIYLETNNINETIPLYVGQSKNILSRWKQHQIQFKKVASKQNNSRTYKKIIHYLNIYNYSLQDLKFAVY